MSWAEDAARALAGEDVPGVEIVRGRRPPLFDAEGVRAILAPLLAAGAWTGAVWREMAVASPIDPLALLLRAVALALTVRAVLSGATFLRRLRVWSTGPRHRLALADEGLVYRSDAGDHEVERADVVAVREHGHWGERSGKRRWSDVYVVTRPDSGRVYLSIPPVFERTPGVLAERLMRWRGPIETPEEVHYPSPARLGSKLYDEAAAGKVPEGGAVIRHGGAWRKRGPYATVLLGIAVVEGLLRMGPHAWEQMGVAVPLAIVLALVAVPLVWTVLTRRAIAPRKGVALVITPAEMLMRTRAGVHRVTWKNLGRMRIESKPAWTILEGYRPARTLVFEPKEGATIRYDEAFLGVPAEVVVSLAEAYRKGALSPRRAPSPGSEAPG